MSEKRKPAKLDDTPKQDKLAGRDTIYVDTDDDITSIIEKVKESDSSVVVLIPPKRVGALQSVVNLKLLQRAAKSGRKKIALITTEASLISLAAGLRIPVAKNLTTQPELPETLDLDNTDNDVINGEDLAIGDLARVSEKPSNRRDTGEDKEISAAVAAIETDDKIKNDVDADGVPDDKPKSKKPAKSKRVPNFDGFRKKLLIFGSLGVALIIFLVWAIVFAPHGTITITAETTAKNIETAVSLRPNTATNIDSKIIQSTVKQVKKTETVDFAATGSREIGEKATGRIVIYNKNATSQSVSLSAGTILRTSGGLQFSLDSAITVSGSTVDASMSIVPGSANANVTAVNFGSEYNIDADVELSVTGYNSTRVYAVVRNDFTGGSKETVKVVQQSDLDAVTEKLKTQSNQSELKDELKSQMNGDTVIIEDSFTVGYGDISSRPAIGEAVSNNSATATVEITYTLFGIEKADLKRLIEAQLGDLGSQKIYDDGISKMNFKNFTASGDGRYGVTVGTTVQIGPNFDDREDRIKENAVGKRSGEIVQDIESIAGVSNVKVEFSPFWVSTAPATNKLKVEFVVNE